MTYRSHLIALITTLIGSAATAAEPTAFRPPAVPLVANDPYFSIWSFDDKLTDGPTRHWTGREHPLRSLVYVDGKPYRLTAGFGKDVQPIPQASVRVLPTRTIYTFANDVVRITLTFMTPALPDDLDVLAWPVTYVTWDVASADGQPHVRMVLLKGHGPEGFAFYTNEQSAKGDQLRANARAALVFHWKSLRRQVRIEGPVERVSAAEADTYFATRLRDSQLGAWASDQSRPLDARDTLFHRLDEVRARFDGRPVERPPHWSGLRVVPDAIELWREGAARLHVRERFERDGSGWRTTLLFP
jgi:pyridoxamine 5'-phosphate oxidase